MSGSYEGVAIAPNKALERPVAATLIYLGEPTSIVQKARPQAHGQVGALQRSEFVPLHIDFDLLRNCVAALQ
jgi:hypothetical protein